MRIVSPPVQNVVPLKSFPIQKIVPTSVPSQKTPIQEVVTLQVVPVHRIDEIPIPTAPIQQVVSLRITPSMKLIESPVSPCTKTVSELSFFWNPVLEDTNKNVSLLNENESETENENELESEFSFFWIPQEVNEVVTKCALNVTKFTSLKSNPIAIYNVPTLPIQNVSETENTTSPLHLHKTRRFSIHKSKVPLQPKQQFSGTCIINSRQLHVKDRLTGTGWKRRRKKRNSHRSKKVLLHTNSPKMQSPKSQFFTKDPSHIESWKFRKKKTVHSNSSTLIENASWKRRKKKQSLAASLKLSHLWKGPSLKRCLAWK